jgi:voltage-gated potassium channel
VETGGGGLRARLYRQLDPRARPAGLSALNKALVWLIVLAATGGVLQTEPELEGRFGALFIASELAFGLIFLAEYLARLWTIAEEPGGHSSWRCRIRFILSPWSILDLVVIVTSLLPLIIGNASVLRLARVARIVRLAKLGRMSSAMTHLTRAMQICKDELILVIMLAGAVLVASATALYWIEGDVQPDKFGSVPRSMWWAVVTMTTIGYGDVFPTTPGGKVAAGTLAIIGVGLIALPAGIMAGALSQIMRDADDDGEERDS